MISRSDYEIWFAKWLDGKLDSHQEEELYAFLVMNPGILEELESAGPLKLKKEKPGFRDKSSLRRSPADLPDDQFDYLCAAMVENDLSPEGQKELLDIISRDKEREKTFEIFRKSKLTSGDSVYNNKYLLKRKTPLQKFLLPAITSAACIAFLITFFLAGNNRSGFKNVADGNSRENPQPGPVIISPENKPAAQNLPAVKNIAAAGENSNLKNDPAPKSRVAGNTGNESQADGSPEPLVQPVPKNRESSPAFRSTYIPVNAAIRIEGLPILTGDPVSASPKPELYAMADERPRVERFLTRAYRELLLGEKDDRPLNRYELAKGGVNGLNRLLGWEMAVLPDSNDEDEMESFQFSSKILNFSVPVKKKGETR